MTLKVRHQPSMFAGQRISDIQDILFLIILRDFT